MYSKSPRRRPSLASVYAWLAVWGLLAGCDGPAIAATPDATVSVAIPTARSPLDLPDELADALQSGAPKTVEHLRLLQSQVRRVVAAGRPVTVAVELNDSVGSGVIISGDGLVLTAGHVCVEPNRELTLRFPDGRRVKGLSLGVNHRLDSGLVRITDSPPTNDDADPTAAAWPFVPMAKGPVEAGEWVVGLGQPNGFVEGRAPPVRLGRVLHVTKDAINTDATLVGGDSGGPLLNLRGEVVGIHSKIGERITSNYHVPVTAYQAEWSRLQAGRMIGTPDGEDSSDWRPMVGMAIRQVAGEIVVTQVFPELAAAEAGVAVGDVLVELAGKSVDSPAALDRLVLRQKAFERVPLVVRRQGVTVRLEVWLGRTLKGFPGTFDSK